MGEPEAHGKMVLVSALSESFDPGSAQCRFGFGPGAGHAMVDGVVAGRIAVEIESRVNKQVRGALMDLVLHPLPLKLLVLVKKHGGNPTTSVNQAEAILSRFVPEGRFRVVLVESLSKGTGIEKDVRLVADAVAQLLALDDGPRLMPRSRLSHHGSVNGGGGI